MEFIFGVLQLLKFDTNLNEYAPKNTKNEVLNDTKYLNESIYDCMWKNYLEHSPSMKEKNLRRKTISLKTLNQNYGQK